jgi:hypothetical protein
MQEVGDGAHDYCGRPAAERTAHPQQVGAG